ncbi:MULTISPECIES: phosphatidate cytidylyltransferase [unclassified Helicobacter]|uniref:phosphatidate cytidylyltransferase n=1 Tax=unclassified Helicobacter TaxID=2593540 RepID=UPI000CF18A42|nr:MULTISPECIES: phosphatidate cytidylyltransferase [unclassified Helicobacter]
MSLKSIFSSDKKRYITGFVLVFILILLIWINNTYLIWAFIGILYLLGVSESLQLFQCPKHPLLFIIFTLIWIGALFNSSPLESGMFFLMLSAGFLAYKQSFSPKFLLPLIYPTLPFLTLYATYLDFGIESLVWLITTIAVSDTAAYFGGKLFGRNPLSQTSPKKTIEGALIGIFFAVVIGSILGIGIFHKGFLTAFVISLIVTLSGILGDLYESLLKRQAQLKDSGNILPGHGGILDRLDAILFGVVAMHFLLRFFTTHQEITLAF